MCIGGDNVSRFATAAATDGGLPADSSRPTVFRGLLVRRETVEIRRGLTVDGKQPTVDCCLRCPLPSTRCPLPATR